MNNVIVFYFIVIASFILFVQLSWRNESVYSTI